MNIFFVVALLYEILFNGYVVCTSKNIINTSSGKIEGKSISIKERTVHQYNIPYAQPPLGELRFKRPKPIEYQENISFSPYSACIQPVLPKDQISEDCLYLSIYVPYINSSESLPIVVIIDGFKFSTNSLLTEEDRINMALNRNYIVVVPQYRVGALGFLNLKKYNSGANLGMYDLEASLIWLDINIKSFNGDKSKVNLLGHSAGAAIAGLFMISPSTRDLFSNIIIMEGSPLAEWVIQTEEESQNTLLQFIEFSECSYRDEEITFLCLQSLKPQVFLDSDIYSHSHFKSSFRIVIDGEIVPEHPLEAFNRGDFSNKNLLIGTNNLEAHHYIKTIIPSVINTDLMEEKEILYHIKDIFPYKYDYEHEYIYHFYGKYLLVERVVEIANEAMFLTPAAKLANIITSHNKSKVYFYQNEIRSINYEYSNNDNVDQEAAVILRQLTLPTNDSSNMGKIAYYFIKFIERGNLDGEMHGFYGLTHFYWERLPYNHEAVMLWDQIIPQMHQCADNYSPVSNENPSDYDDKDVQENPNSSAVDIHQHLVDSAINFYFEEFNDSSAQKNHYSIDHTVHDSKSSTIVSRIKNLLYTTSIVTTELNQKEIC